MSQNLQKRPKKLLDQAREVIRRKHYSIREERDGNPYAQYDAQPEEQNGRRCTPPALILAPVSARSKLDLRRSVMSSGLKRA